MNKVNIPVELPIYIFFNSEIGSSKIEKIVIKMRPITPCINRNLNGLKKLISIIYFSIVLLKAIKKWLRIENNIAKNKFLIFRTP